ncbi:MAG: tautomerase family protein [Candidatus Thiodiazotropha sp. (ex. Lucinisca nassula)]|nr:tautomerase family protein [Candidatus Thiodiazotropha sp. (ex. Lucinisca nassula)]MBW9260349.1 tautomerase family protein [Candidatus Thiodiazotropha sp. (ex. Lucinisca nassula)]
MPVIKIQHSGEPLSKDTCSMLQRQVTGLINRVLGKAIPVTAVLISSLPNQQWSVAGDAITQHRSALMEIYITSGTNSVDEKRQMIREAYALLEAVLGALVEASYVVIQELESTDWGFAGLTQDERRRMKAPI